MERRVEENYEKGEVGYWMWKGGSVGKVSFKKSFLFQKSFSITPQIIFPFP